MSQQQNEFEVAGTCFRLSPLKIEPALRGEQIVAEAVFPVIAAGLDAAQGRGRIAVKPEVIRSALAGTRALPELVQIFTSACEVKWQGAGYVPLADFADLVFARKNAALLAWLLACVEWQYADFFGGDGLALVVEAGSRLICRLGSTGESGASPQTPA